MPGDLHQLQNEVGRWKARWEMVNVAERPMYTTVAILLVMSVSTATADRSFSAMRRLKNSLFHAQ